MYAECTLPGCENDEEVTVECQGCHRAYYCSMECKHDDWPAHIVFCAPEPQVDPIYFLYCACVHDFVPGHERTRRWFKFDRAALMNKEHELLELYRAIFDLRPGVRTVDAVNKWQEDEVLVPKIREFFHKYLRNPGSNRSYRWFMRNQWVLDETLPIPNQS
ncbi:hypothetical protein EIP86_000115 [Pleurotus ostreatoroseus]|nr:hypothetical protein EIP86_000115 [Pleurotus ostreatoroseus]